MMQGTQIVTVVTEEIRGLSLDIKSSKDVNEVVFLYPLPCGEDK